MRERIEEEERKMRQLNVGRRRGETREEEGRACEVGEERAEWGMDGLVY